VRTNKDQMGYIWICKICFDAKRVNESTPLNAMNPVIVDFALSMWVRNATPTLSGEMSALKTPLSKEFQLFRKSYTHYMKSRVLPYLVLPGPVEIDEAKIGRRRWHFRGYFPRNIKWAFGLYCRKTGIPILYEIKHKGHEYLVSMLKKHMRSGTVLLSDHHASYVTLRSGKSHMARYGFFHFWINHSSFFVHEKFHFVYTANIERVWCQLRHQQMCLKF